jgi:hypothetical protein
MLITNKSRTENWQLAYRLVLNGKIIWDNVEFESILLDGLHNDPKNFYNKVVIIWCSGYIPSFFEQEGLKSIGNISLTISENRSSLWITAKKNMLYLD